MYPYQSTRSARFHISLCSDSFIIKRAIIHKERFPSFLLAAPKNTLQQNAKLRVKT